MVIGGDSLLISTHKTVGAKCHKCNSNIYTQIDPFRLNGKFSVRCDTCGEEFIFIQKNKQSRYAVSIECYVCEETHRYDIAHSAFWRNEIFALGCHASGIDICYIGDEKQVEQAMQQLDERLEHYVGEIDKTIFTELGETTQKALQVIEEMVKQHNIMCLCGHCELEASVRREGIVISCASCGASEYIETRTPEDIEVLSKRKTIVLV